MGTLSEATVAILGGLHFRAEARRMVSLIPLGSIYWEDEMPDYLSLMKLSEDEKNAVWRLFAIRFKIWDSERLSAEDESFWESARSDVPDWALFFRLTLSADDREARRQTEAEVEKEFESFFGDADHVEVTDKDHGIQEWSATFDLTKKTDSER